MECLMRRRIITLSLIVLGAGLAFSVSSMIVKPSAKPKYARHITVTADLSALARKLDDYKAAHGQYPTTAQGLRAVIASATDPWGSAYVYRGPGILNPNG